MKKKHPMTRSENMARVKNKNTKPEIYLRKLLWHRGLRYRINYKQLPGSPDIFIPRYNTIIFVNGCFWHMHENCKYSSIPKTNRDFWEKKLKSNVKRDEENYDELNKMGYNVIVVWQCEINKMKNDESILENIINKIIK